MQFWCFQFTFQCFLLINLETWWKKDAYGGIETQQWQSVNSTSVITRLQLLSKKVWAMIHKTFTHVNELPLPNQ